MIIRELTIEDGEKSVTFKVAPTPLAVLGKHAATFAKGTAAPASEAIEAVIECVYAGARRAKSAITLEWLRENVDAAAEDAITAVFLEVNGLKRPEAAAPSPESPSGEAKAAGAS